MNCQHLIDSLREIISESPALPSSPFTLGELNEWESEWDSGSEKRSVTIAKAFIALEDLNVFQQICKTNGGGIRLFTLRDALCGFLKKGRQVRSRARKGIQYIGLGVDDRVDHSDRFLKEMDEARATVVDFANQFATQNQDLAVVNNENALVRFKNSLRFVLENPPPSPEPPFTFEEGGEWNELAYMANIQRTIAAELLDSFSVRQAIEQLPRWESLIGEVRGALRFRGTVLSQWDARSKLVFFSGKDGAMAEFQLDVISELLERLEELGRDGDETKAGAESTVATPHEIALLRTDLVIQDRLFLVTHLKVDETSYTVTLGGETFSNLKPDATKFFASALEAWPRAIVLSEFEPPLRSDRFALPPKLDSLVERRKNGVTIDVTKLRQILAE